MRVELLWVLVIALGCVLDGGLRAWRDLPDVPAVAWTPASAGGGQPMFECGDGGLALCPFGWTCVDRACAPLCTPLRPAGVCVEAGARCEQGTCVVPERPSRPAVGGLSP
ncbi:MAG: hypothetical protein KF729_02920 [Sandaracinaceae bacterium]|nr:hypothetical protein [Sandaracinaceae bacterium]